MAKNEIDDDVNLDGLSPEEREAMEEAAAEAKGQIATETKEREEEDAAAAEALKAAAEEEDEDEDEGGDESDAEAEPEKTEAKAAEDEDEGGPAPKAEDDVELRAVLAEKAPRLVSFGEEDAAKLAGLDAERDALLDKLDGGELDREAFRKAQKEIDAQAAALEAKRQRAEESAEAFQEWDQRQWSATLKSWMAAHPEFTTDIAGETDPVRKARSEVLNEIVKQQAGVKRTGTYSYHDLLDEALALYAVKNPKDEGLRESKRQQKAPEDKPKKKAATSEKKRPEIPPRLSKMPAAAISDADDSPFGAIDKLSPEKFERMLMRMTPEQLEAYERG